MKVNVTYGHNNLRRDEHNAVPHAEPRREVVQLLKALLVCVALALRSKTHHSRTGTSLPESLSTRCHTRTLKTVHLHAADICLGYVLLCDVQVRNAKEVRRASPNLVEILDDLRDAAVHHREQVEPHNERALLAAALMNTTRRTIGRDRSFVVRCCALCGPERHVDEGSLREGEDHVSCAMLAL